jgi:[ribosomal protein S5]-alanine N-acetyltransferase
MMKIDLISRDIKLRRFKKTDAQRMSELANNENVSRNLTDGFHHPYTFQHAEEFIKRFIDQDPVMVFAIEYKGEYTGNISLVKGTDFRRKSAEIGYFIGEPFWNKGIATTAVNLITEYGFKNLDIVRIHTGIFEYNPASMRVLEKCGFKKEGIFQKSVYKQGKLWDEVRFAKLKEQ